MMTHHVVHESFKNNISNNTHNIAQGPPCFQGGKCPLLPPKCNPVDEDYNFLYFESLKLEFEDAGAQLK